MSAISVAHVSSTLRKACHPRADEVHVAEVSGFWVGIEPASWAPGGQITTVGYQDYDYDGDYSNRAQEVVGRIVEDALDAYAATLRKAGYVTEDWVRYDGVRLGLFVTGRA
jgi:hypothetical protein